MTKQERKEYIKKHFQNPFKVDDILHNSWGYDQTNCEYYQIVATTRATVTLRPIKSEAVKDSQGFMSEMVTPVKDAFCKGFLGALKRYAGMGTEITKKVSCYIQDSGELRYFIPTEHGFCDLWNGKPNYSSWYA